MAVESNSWATQKKFDVNSIRKKISGVAYLSKFYFRLVASINGAVDSKVKKILSEQKMQDLFIYANNVTVPQRAIDGENYTYQGKVLAKFPDNIEGSLQKDFKLNVKNLKARYIKIKAENYGICPDWHLGAGGKTWIFVDEITIK